MTIPNIVRSTENPGKVSLTLQGAFVVLVIYIAHQFGFDVSGNDALLFVEGLTVIISGAATVIGIVRKIKNGKLHG